MKPLLETVLAPAEVRLSFERFHSILAGRMNPGTVLRVSEPLARRTTMRVGGSADLFLEPATGEDLSAALRLCREEGIPWMALGRGSNLLVRDGGIRGLVISLANPAFSTIEVEGTQLRCGAGAKLKTIAVAARRHGLSGLEFMEGIPGSLGGALRMNAGAMGGATFDRVARVRYMDSQGQVHEKEAGEFEVRYRNCAFLKTHIALGAILEGFPAPPETIAEKMNVCSRKRWSSQPAAPSAGCIFKNPLTVPAGQLIEELGLKGKRIGEAAVSEVHGNFMVNEGKAKARDVLDLIALIQERAWKERGIELETEVEIVGEDLAPAGTE
jgi:UDP-N-acetylenolpyruvoylglucosamine reductase